jgi:hypothetical protein
MVEQWRGMPADPVDRSRAHRNPVVGVAEDERETSLVRQLRFRVYVREQGKHFDEIDWTRGELPDPLDTVSRLWYAREDSTAVGTLAQTIIGPEFDLSRLPSGLGVEHFPVSSSRPLGFSSRFVIAPGYRSTWVPAGLARHSYVYGRRRGGTFDFMATHPGLVPLFERLGYVRYTASGIRSPDIGLLIPMVLPGADHEHLLRTRSILFAVAREFSPEPESGAWLRSAHPIIRVYYDQRQSQRRACVARVADRIGIPVAVASDLLSTSFVHHFPAGTTLRLPGDRVTYTFVDFEGTLSFTAMKGELECPCAPDAVPFSRVSIRCETDAVVLCVPDTSVLRVARRYREQCSRLRDFTIAANRLG